MDADEITDAVARAIGRQTEDDPDALLGAIVAALEAGGYTVTPPRPVLPVLPELPDGAQACPHVKDDGTVCGAPLNLWDKDPVQRSLYWEDGVGWIAGPSSSADDGGGDEEVQCYELHTWALPDIADWQ